MKAIDSRLHSSWAKVVKCLCTMQGDTGQRRAFVGCGWMEGNCTPCHTLHFVVCSDENYIFLPNNRTPDGELLNPVRHWLVTSTLEWSEKYEV